MKIKPRRSGYLDNVGAAVAAEDAPVDDEPESEEERAAVAEAREDVRAGRLLAHAELVRRWLGPQHNLTCVGGGRGK